MSVLSLELAAHHQHGRVVGRSPKAGSSPSVPTCDAPAHEPFGEEMIVVIASKSPLFETERPKVEVERDFLTALRKAILARPINTADDRVVTADYVLLKTREN